MQSQIQVALTKAGGEKVLDGYKVKQATKGPAITLLIEKEDGSVKFDVDIVLCVHAEHLSNGSVEVM